KTSGLVCAVRTADCLPVFLSSKKNKTIGMVHMGWRGAKSGILNNIKEDLTTFKAIAGVGLRQCCYAVGKDFLTYEGFPEFINESSKGLYFNPVGFARKKLKALGLEDENFYDLNICSLCSDKGLFSYRKNATDKRTLSFILRY
ncbi:MAG: polyphenol oxidase family protein, partial [Candidatus Omnitrophota bacterium]